MGKNKHKKKLTTQGELKLTEKKIPINGVISLMLGILAIILFLIACIYSGFYRGKAGQWVGIMGFISLILSAIGIFFSWLALKEDNIRVVLPSIAGILNVIITLFFVILYVISR
ncbi:MAG: DUF6142 family protein [Lachnospiraceae bacterium]|nr:DUF6142 family protein [Lachnospiraceae bacterium]